MVGMPSKMLISKGNSKGPAGQVKECIITEEPDACFIKNSEFDY
jgi:hypothetical protein